MKDIHNIDCSEKNWVETEESDQWKKLKHNELDLYFLYRYNVHADNMLEFQIYDGTRYLGRDAHYCKDQEEHDKWKNSFIFQKMFVVWLSTKKIQIF